jgi:hypothetical protein
MTKIMMASLFKEVLNIAKINKNIKSKNKQLSLNKPLSLIIDKEILEILKEFNQISIYDLEEILEWLYDKDYLNINGIMFMEKLCKLFIKKDN